MLIRSNLTMTGLQQSLRSFRVTIRRNGRGHGRRHGWNLPKQTSARGWWTLWLDTWIQRRDFRSGTGHQSNSVGGVQHVQRLWGQSRDNTVTMLNLWGSRPSVNNRTNPSGNVPAGELSNARLQNREEPDIWKRVLLHFQTFISQSWVPRVTFRCL